MRAFNVVLACVSVLLLNNPAFANSSAKFKKIERELKECVNLAESSASHNGCFRGYIYDYEKAFNSSQKSQFKKRKKACIAKFGDLFSMLMSDVEDSYALDCMHKAAKSIAKVKKVTR